MPGKIALLAERGQRVLCPGPDRASRGCDVSRDGKTDAKDARIIADQARMRADLQPVRSGDQISAELRMLTSRRTDLVYDRVRAINRLRALMVEVLPGLGSGLRLLQEGRADRGVRLPDAGGDPPDWGHSVSVLVEKRLCRGSTLLARKAVEAANAQRTALLTEAVAARLVAQLAEQIAAIDVEIARLDEQISERVDQHPDAPMLLSMPGFGPVSQRPSSPTPAVTCTHSRPSTVSRASPASPQRHATPAGSAATTTAQTIQRRLMRTCYLAALASLKNSPSSRGFYERKRVEGKSHKQALIALARRRLTVLWAMLRDRTTYEEPPPPALAPAA
jgi:transposase